MTIELCTTPSLNVAYQVSGPVHGAPLLLLHGWPDDPTTFDAISPTMHDAGFRTIAPWLRGCGPTRFRFGDTPRSGEVAALAQDAIDLADGLGLDDFAVVGHGWGGRTALALASLFSRRVTHCVAISAPKDPASPSRLELLQARAYWHQWFLSTEPGAAVLRSTPDTFARFLWESWSPPGWVDDEDFDAVAASFENPDWAAVALHAFRVRWGLADPDPGHAALSRRLSAAPPIPVPTLLIHGEEDRCVLPASTEGPYERRLLDGVGHFPTREAPDRVAALVERFLSPDAVYKLAS